MNVQQLAREAEVHALDLVDRAMPDVLTHLLRAAATATGATGARINIVSGGRQHSVVDAYGEPSSMSADESFCALVIQQEEAEHLVPDAADDPRFADLELVTSGAVRSYASSVLVTENDVPIGTVCVWHEDPDRIRPEAMAVLNDLAAAAMSVLESRRRFEALHDVAANLTDGTRELRRSNEHLAAFAGQVSHDVQGPLASVLAALQMMEEEHPEMAEDILLTSALSGAQRMRATIAGLMDFAVVGGTLRRERVDMNELVSHVLSDLHARLGRAKVHVEDLPPVCGDRVQLRAVTQNLIANALKYAGDWPVVEVRGVSEEGRTRIVVSDDGPGVPDEQRDSIFRLNVRGEGVELTGVDGLGIGLATCKRIIDSHGGTIGVGESEQHGAEFWYEIPEA